jgi:DNA-binding IclR family transcriptional regulator
MMNGPSPYAVTVLRALLKEAPMPIKRIAEKTRLPVATVHDQVVVLRQSEALELKRAGKHLYVYSPVVHLP